MPTTGGIDSGEQSGGPLAASTEHLERENDRVG
jgi:hypothetical protein